METKKVAKEYLQKIFCGRFSRCGNGRRMISRSKIIVLDYDLTEYHWKTNIKKLQEEGFWKRTVMRRFRH